MARRSGGTGLGLAISARRLGSGSRPAKTPPEASEAGAARPLRILLAEDHIVNRRLAERLLQKQGHTVLAAKNGLETLATLARETVDLVLMDVQMPGMDGLEATRAIRRWEGDGRRRVPIIALTAHALVGNREQCLAAGMDAYVTKPIQADELRRAITNLTGSGHGAQAACGAGSD